MSSKAAPRPSTRSAPRILSSSGTYKNSLFCPGPGRRRVGGFRKPLVLPSNCEARRYQKMAGERDAELQSQAELLISPTVWIVDLWVIMMTRNKPRLGPIVLSGIPPSLGYSGLCGRSALTISFKIITPVRQCTQLRQSP
eukprot:1773738-Rhodomonas_salina.2